MPANLTQFIDAWAALPVLVVGDVMLDSYLHGTADRLCQEAPVPVVALDQRQDFPGGAANTASNIASLGAEAVLLSVIGTESEGDRFQRSLEPHRVDLTSLIRSPQRTTLAKQRILAASQLLLRLDQGSTGAIDPATEQALIDRLQTLFPACAAVIVSDYGYGILTPAVIQTLAKLQATAAKPLVVDSKQLSAYRQVGVTAVKPNYQEAIRLLGLAQQARERADQLMPYGDRLLQLTGAAMVAVTLDAEGALLFERGQPPIQMAARPAPAQQTSGAGDTFVSAFTLALAAGAAPPAAASLACAATAIVVQQPGTTPCTAIELRQSLNQPTTSKQISDRLELARCVQQHRSAGHHIVFTNGCFDILHPGHVRYLTQARAGGDILIVGVNSDDSVRQLKGPDRPVNLLADRLTMLAALSCVDYVVPFSELTPHRLIQLICPDTFVKGGDYTRDSLPEAELVEALGGSVKLLPYQNNHSTTRLIRHIQTLPS